MKIILVHGIFNLGSIFFFMKNMLEKNGFHCHTPNLRPIDGKYGIEDLAKKLKREINKKFGESEKLILIGFSMGGITSRYYLQNLNGVKRVSHFFSISSPHYGSYLAYLYPGKGTKQLRPKSIFLNTLNENVDILNGIKKYSYWTPFDLSILPSSNSNWEKAENVKFYSILHPLMLFNKNVIREIISKVLA